jgi:hypothetical protein
MDEDKPIPTGRAAVNAGAAGTTVTGEEGHTAIEKAGGGVKDPEGYEGHAGSATVDQITPPEEAEEAEKTEAPARRGRKKAEEVEE